MIFHSYVSLPEGNTRKSLEGIQFWSQELASNHNIRTRPIVVAGAASFFGCVLSRDTHPKQDEKHPNH